MGLTTTGPAGASFSWRDAVLAGLAPGGHLFVPAELPSLTPESLASLRSLDFRQLAVLIANQFLAGEVEAPVVERICRESFNFPLRLVPITEHVSVLELFHGPTCAFKDFGARFMARLFRHFLGDSGEKLTVLVATSGDTGSAVANAFFDTAPDAPISVTVLFPKGKVSAVQEKQMTTLGHNVRAFEVDGTFDDCQRLVKAALADPEVTSRLRLTSANSINIARLLPQSFYYFWAWSRLPEGVAPFFAVPSGNLGNLTGGVIAHRMGLPTTGFIAAHNRNDIFPQYLESGVFEPRPSVETVSNAMDVGNPSNYARLASLFSGTHQALAALVQGASFTDDETIAGMKRVHDEHGYMLDPHGAVGFLAATRALETRQARGPAVVLGTAHPAKFPDAALVAFGEVAPTPTQLKVALQLEGRKEQISGEYAAFRLRLLNS